MALKEMCIRDRVYIAPVDELNRCTLLPVDLAPSFVKYRLKMCIRDRVITFELNYKTTIKKKLKVDATFTVSEYLNVSFQGYNSCLLYTS